MYVPGERNYGRSHKLYIFLFKINNGVDIAMSVSMSLCPTISSRTTNKFEKMSKFCAQIKIISFFGHALSRSVNR